MQESFPPTLVPMSLHGHELLPNKLLHRFVLPDRLGGEGALEIGHDPQMRKMQKKMIKNMKTSYTS